MTQEIQKLKGLDIGNQEEVMAAVEILEAFDTNLYGLLIEHEVFFDETGIGMVMNLYRQSIVTLKVHEGIDLEKSRVAYRAALRLIQLVLGCLYDICRGAEAPRILSELL